MGASYKDEGGPKRLEIHVRMYSKDTFYKIYAFLEWESNFLYIRTRILAGCLDEFDFLVLLRAGI